MSRIVFFSIPAHGHTNPTLGVVRELIARGHEVWYYSYEPMREKIEASGAHYVSCDAYDAQQRLMAKDGARIGRDLAFSMKILVDTTLALDEHVCADMKRMQPDCIVADSMAVWGKEIALKLGIPFVSSTTTFAFNQHSAKIMKRSLKELLVMLMTIPKVKRYVRRLKEKGYPVKSVLDIIGNDENTHTIVYTSPEFQPCSETFSDKYAFVGPSVRPATGEIHKTGDKLVYISMGTVNNDMLPFYRNCVLAFADTAYQVILSVGCLVSLEDLGKLPENVSAYAHVDQIAALEKADVFISHCGMNSVSESLYFGVPLVMLPQTSEQAGVAERVGQLGAGMKLRGNDPVSILEAVEQVLGEASYRKNAQRISEGFRRSPGAKGAADKIEQVCGLCAEP